MVARRGNVSVRLIFDPLRAAVIDFSAAADPPEEQPERRRGYSQSDLRSMRRDAPGAKIGAVI